MLKTVMAFFAAGNETNELLQFNGGPIYLPM